MRRHLVLSQMFLAISPELFDSRILTRLSHNPCLDGFAAVRVWDAADAHFQDFRMRRDRLLHLTRPHLEAARLDEFLLAVYDVEVAIFVHAGNVACEQP